MPLDGYNVAVFEIGDVSGDYSRVSVMFEQGLTNYPPFTDNGCVYATGLNDFGQLGTSESKPYSVV